MEIYLNRDHLLKHIAYPRRYQPDRLLKTSGVIFGIILIFLLLFRPFGVSGPEQKMSYFFICCLHALSPAIILYAYFRALNYLKKTNTIAQLTNSYVNGRGSWTLLQEYLHVGTVLLLAGTAGFLMRDLIYYNKDNWSLYYLWEEIKNALIAGSLFYIFLRLTGFYFESQKGSPFVLQFVPLQGEPQLDVKQSLLFIKTQVKQDDFSLCLNDLIFVKAEGNYIELTSLKDGQFNTELKRISLTQFELQLSKHPNFFRCHRAYLVNMLYIGNVSGNSQGYSLSFSGTGSTVPVSRTQLENFNGRYAQLQVRYSA